MALNLYRCGKRVFNRAALRRRCGRHGASQLCSMNMPISVGVERGKGKVFKSVQHWVEAEGPNSTLTPSHTPTLSLTRIATEMPVMSDWDTSVLMLRPLTADTTEMAGVSTPSPTTCKAGSKDCHLQFQLRSTAGIKFKMKQSKLQQSKLQKTADTKEMAGVSTASLTPAMHSRVSCVGAMKAKAKRQSGNRS